MKPLESLASESRHEAGRPAPAIQRAEKHFGIGGRFFRWRNALGTAFALFLILFPWGRMEVKPWQVALGLALVTAGVGLRLWAILQIGGSARKKSSLKAVRVIEWGPFAIVRNPIYIANMTVFAGFTVLSGLLWALPLVAGGLFLWYDALVRREESFLRATFPVNYDTYTQRTNRWLPALRSCRRPAEIPPYPLARALRRERSHLLLVACGVVVFWALSVFHDGPVAGAQDSAPLASPRSHSSGSSVGARASTDAASTSLESSSVPRPGEGSAH